MKKKDRCSLSEIVDALCGRWQVSVPSHEEYYSLNQALTACGCRLSCSGEKKTAVERVAVLDADGRKERVKKAMSQIAASAAFAADTVILSNAAREMVSLALTLQYLGIHEKRRNDLLAVFAVALEVLNPTSTSRN